VLRAFVSHRREVCCPRPAILAVAEAMTPRILSPVLRACTCRA
jgi:hypothetical protein